MNEIESISNLFNFEKIMLLLIGIFSLWILSKFIQFFVEKITEIFPSKRFLVLQINTLSSFIIYLGGSAAIFISVINPPKEIVLATAGSLAVAIGFALKDVAASIIAGVILIFDTPFKTGDRITFDGNYGEIIAIGLRSVKINTLDDNIVTIPNARFINDVVASGNYGALDMMVVCSFHIGLDNDIAKVCDFIREVIVTSRFSYLRKDINFSIIEVVMHDKVAIRVDAKAYVMDVHYEKSFQSDIVSTVNALFQKHAISRP